MKIDMGYEALNDTSGSQTGITTHEIRITECNIGIIPIYIVFRPCYIMAKVDGKWCLLSYSGNTDDKGKQQLYVLAAVSILL